MLGIIKQNGKYCESYVICARMIIKFNEIGRKSNSYTSNTMLGIYIYVSKSIYCADELRV